MSAAVLLPVEALRFSSKKRKGISQKRVEELIRTIEWDEEIMPIRVQALGDGTYVVRDGRHRLSAHLALGISYILAIVENSKAILKRIFSSLFKILSQLSR